MSKSQELVCGWERIIYPHILTKYDLLCIPKNCRDESQSPERAAYTVGGWFSCFSFDYFFLRMIKKGGENYGVHSNNINFNYIIDFIHRKITALTRKQTVIFNRKLRG